MNPDLNTFLQTYPASVQAAAAHYRAFIQQHLPEITETLDAPAKMIGYAYGPGYVDMVCTLLLSQKGLKMGFYKGSELPDPAGLLEGSGKVHRYVVLKEGVSEAALAELLQEGHVAYLKRKKLG